MIKIANGQYHVFYELPKGVKLVEYIIDGENIKEIIRHEEALCMKKVVIAGSAKLQNEVNKWLKIFESKEYEILDYPRVIEELKFIELYPNVHTEFLENITKTDMLFIMNEDKNGVIGYIGYEAYAELLFGLSQKLIYNKNIELIMFKMPSTDVGCYEEIDLWLKLGWIKLYEEKNL